MKVRGISKPYYTVRRRVIDGGFECSCPQWVEERKECKHVIPVKGALSGVDRPPSPIDRAITEAVRVHPAYIANEAGLIARIKLNVREALSNIRD